MNPVMATTLHLGIQPDLVSQNNTLPSVSSSEQGSDSACPTYGALLEEPGPCVPTLEDARIEGVHMLSQELDSAKGDIPGENRVGADLIATLNSKSDAIGVTDARRPLAELTVPSGEMQRVEQGHSVAKKQLLTKSEREAVRLERERAKEEARLKKEAERQRKELERREKKEAMERRERERLEKKEQEREFKERKEAERRKKEEEKEAEKNLKVELKKQQELEKEKANEEKLRKQQITKERFMSFFTKVETIPSSKESSVQFTLFTPFTVKPNMVLAKRSRPPLQDTVTFDSLLESQSSPTSYLATCRLRQKARPKIETVPTSCARPMDDVVIISSPPEGGSSPSGGVSGVQRRKYKLFQFHDNHRPAYYGTWSSISTVVGPRNPFKLDKEMLNYDVDSDEEWEEEEPGEDISHSENEQESGEEEEGDNDGFFVPHGYLSKDEGQSSEEEEGKEGENRDQVKTVTAATTNDKHKERQQAKAKAWEAKCTNTWQPIRPLKIGCVWLDAITPEQPLMSREEQLLRQFTAVTLTEVPIAVETVVAVHTAGEETTPNVYSGSERRPVPVEAMPDLISLVHKSPMGLSRLNSTFRIHWATKLSNNSNNNTCGSQQASPGFGRTLDVSRTPDSNLIEEASGISKRQLTMKITSLAVKEQRPPSNRPLWYVHDSVFKQYNLDPQRVTPLVPLQPDKPSVMSPDDSQNGKRPPKRAVIGTPTIRDLWSKPHARAGGKMSSPALAQEEDPPLSKRLRPDEQEVIMIDAEPSSDVGGGGLLPSQQDDVAAPFVAGGVVRVSTCAPAVLKQEGASQGVEPMVKAMLSSEALKLEEREELVTGLMVESCAVEGTFVPAEDEPT